MPSYNVTNELKHTVDIGCKGGDKIKPHNWSMIVTIYDKVETTVKGAVSVRGVVRVGR